jgi:hypothetical protein
MILDPPITPYYSTVVQVRALYVLALENDIGVQQRQASKIAMCPNTVKYASTSKFIGGEDFEFPGHRHRLIMERRRET